MFTFSSTILAILIAASAGIAFTGGYTISNWRSAAQVQRLSSANATLSEANKKCDADIKSVQEATEALTQAAAQREKNAENAIKRASLAAENHTKRARKIRALSPVSPSRQYEAIAREQAEY